MRPDAPRRPRAVCEAAALVVLHKSACLGEYKRLVGERPSDGSGERPDATNAAPQSVQHGTGLHPTAQPAVARRSTCWTCWARGQNCEHSDTEVGHAATRPEPQIRTADQLAAIGALPGPPTEKPA